MDGGPWPRGITFCSLLCYTPLFYREGSKPCFQRLLLALVRNEC
ncbi:protein of unknown function [Kyrpidia spormannii]|uniref:Uncharacterized protein n=1 Tax=Kyrpidia spormannii TaxID=2055160 RepID=A0A6F9E680_9BACL|nr:protein of unknown function [Kyrpidia spormannii]